MHVKIAHQLIHGATPVGAEHLHDGMGVRIAWVEIDGKRYTEVLDANVSMGSNKPTVTTLALFAATEVVLLDANGEEIG